MEEPAGVGMYLGCMQEVQRVTTESGAPLTTFTYNMEEFLVDCVKVYKKEACLLLSPDSTRGNLFVRRMVGRNDAARKPSLVR